MKRSSATFSLPWPLRPAPLLLAAWLSLGGACLAPYIISDAKEVEMGRGLVEQLESNPEFRLLRDPEVEGYINEIAQRLIPASPVRRSFPFTFKVAINEQVNAFALPGGTCYVQTGLIEAAETESELVGVIAHEVSHVTLGHHRNMFANQVFVQTAEGLVFDENSPAVAVLATRAAAGLGMLTFSRGQESEADRVGLETMWRAGWNPRGLRDFFERLAAAQGGEPGRLAAILSTHPTNSARIASIDQMLRQLPPRPDLISDSPRFHLIQRRVAELVGD